MVIIIKNIARGIITKKINIKFILNSKKLNEYSDNNQGSKKSNQKIFQWLWLWHFYFSFRIYI